MTALAVVVASSAAAFGIATPAARIIAIARARAAGVVVKDPDALMALGAIDVACFDKSGTLTNGDPTVVALRWARYPIDTNTLEDALAIELQASHRVGRAIARYLSAQGVRAAPLAHSTVTENRAGIAARTRGRLVELGSPHRWDRSAQDVSTHASAVWLVVNGETIATFELFDALRPGAEKALRLLWEQGVASRALSGDRPESASTLGHRLGIPASGGLTPAQKALVIRELQLSGARVAFVGDGSGDAAGAAQADVAIAIAPDAMPSSVPAPIVLTDGRLSQLAWLVALARAADARMRENAILSALYNAIVIPMAALGLLSPLYAGALMLIETLVVLTNASRLLGIHVGRPPTTTPQTSTQPAGRFEARPSHSATCCLEERRGGFERGHRLA
jgi:Cu+-exporting ATPase